MHTAIQLPTQDFLATLLDASEPPCISIYQPTHRHRPDNQQDPIRFRNLVKQVQQSLQQSFKPAQVAACIEPLLALERDGDFWNHTLDGLAVFGAPGFFGCVALHETVPELALVADRFHIRPLWRFLQTTNRYQILSLSLGQVKLFEGNRDALEEIDLAPGVPRSLTDALGDQLTEPRHTVASYGGTGLDSTAMHHGHGGRKDSVDIDTDRFFRRLDVAIQEHPSGQTGLPLILGALPEHQTLFHQISHNPLLMGSGLKLDPASLSIDELRTRAWDLLQPQQDAAQKKLSERFVAARSASLGADNLESIGPAAAAGRVDVLMLEAGRQIRGRVDAGTGSIKRSPENAPEAEDVLDELAALVLLKGGRVTVVPAGQMPTDAGVAAIYRF